MKARAGLRVNLALQLLRHGLELVAEDERQGVTGEARVELERGDGRAQAPRGGR